MVKKINFSEALAKAAADERNHTFVSTASGIYSFGVVNNINGKRLSISKALAKALGLENYIEILPSFDENVLFVGKKIPVDKPFFGTLSGSDKKICYSTELVTRVTTAFNLDFSTKTSMSVSDVEITEIGDFPVAVVYFPDSGKSSTSPDGDGE